MLVIKLLALMDVIIFYCMMLLINLKLSTENSPGGILVRVFGNCTLPLLNPYKEDHGDRTMPNLSSISHFISHSGVSKLR